MYDLIAEHGVTHLCGAPIVMSTLLNARAGGEAAAAACRALLHRRRAAAAAVLAAMREAGFEVTHLYGLTETYGPAVVNDWKERVGRARRGRRRRAMKARQGVRYHALEALDVIDPETMQPRAAPTARRWAR